MAVTNLQIILVALLLACLSSFGWAMRYFFVQPSGMTTGMRVTTWCGVAFAAMHLAALLWPASVTPSRGYAAALLYAAALALFWWTIASNRRAPLSAVFSPDLPAHLNQHGPYRIVRHPFYCSYLITWIAGVVATRQWWLASTVVVMLAIYVRAARAEERKFSSSSLAGSYDSYRAKTGLFLPNPRKLLMIRRSR